MLHRGRTGEGQHIDLSQVEGGIVCLTETILTWTANGDILTRAGNRSRHAAPHGVFRCADRDGKERWVAIAIHDDDDWRRLVRAIGEPAWTSDRALATTTGRLARADDIERALEEWTRTRKSETIAAELQAAGIDATPVEDFGDLHDDAQLAHRQHFPEVEHAVLGRHPVETHAMRFSAMAPKIRLPAPRLGEHTEHVLTSLLGMERAEYERLRDAGIFE